MRPAAFRRGPRHFCLFFFSKFAQCRNGPFRPFPKLHGVVMRLFCHFQNRLGLATLILAVFKIIWALRHSFLPFSKSFGANETYFLPLAKVSFISNKLREIFTISFRLAQETRVGKYRTILAPIRISPSVRSSSPLQLSMFANQLYMPTMKTMQHTIVPTQKMIDAIVPSTFSALSFCTLLLIVLSFDPS